MLGSLIVREIKKNLCDGCDGHFAVLKVKLFVLSSSSSLKGNRGRIAPSVRLSLTAKAVVLFSLTVVSTPIVFCSGWWTLDSGQHYTILYGPSRSLDGDGDDNNDGDDDDDDDDGEKARKRRRRRRQRCTVQGRRRRRTYDSLYGTKGSA